LLGITALSQSPISSLGGTNVNVAVTGIQLNATIDNVTTVQANANIDVTGIPLTSSVESVVIDLNTIVEVDWTRINFIFRRGNNFR
jgi:hypothetical protein